MTSPHFTEYQLVCPYCERKHTLVLTDDVWRSERITCSACKKEMAEVGDLLSPPAMKNPPPKSNLDSGSRVGGG